MTQHIRPLTFLSPVVPHAWQILQHLPSLIKDSLRAAKDQGALSDSSEKVLTVIRTIAAFATERTAEESVAHWLKAELSRTDMNDPHAQRRLVSEWYKKSILLLATKQGTPDMQRVLNELLYGFRLLNEWKVVFPPNETLAKLLIDKSEQRVFFDTELAEGLLNFALKILPSDAHPRYLIRVAKLFNHLAFQYIESNSDKTVHYAQRALTQLALARKHSQTTLWSKRVLTMNTTLDILYKRALFLSFVCHEKGAFSHFVSTSDPLTSLLKIKETAKKIDDIYRIVFFYLPPTQRAYFLLEFSAIYERLGDHFTLISNNLRQEINTEMKDLLDLFFMLSKTSEAREEALLNYRMALELLTEGMKTSQHEKTVPRLRLDELVNKLVRDGLTLAELHEALALDYLQLAHHYASDTRKKEISTYIIALRAEMENGHMLGKIERSPHEP